MIKMKELNITPNMATELLKQNTGNFRQINQGRVLRYADDMRHERWMFSGDPIRFDIDGQLLDGQHRLKAIIASGTTQRMVLMEGLLNESALTMDKGQPRSVRSWLTHKGTKNAVNVSSIAKHVMMHRKNCWHVIAWGSAYSSDSEIIQFAEDHDDTLQSAFRIANHVGKKSGIGTTILGAIMHEAAYPETCESIELCQWFCESMERGIGLSKTDAVYHLRERLTVKHATQKESPFMVRTLSTIAWNRTAEQLPTKVLRYNLVGPQKSEPVMRIVNLSGFEVI